MSVLELNAWYTMEERQKFQSALKKCDDVTINSLCRCKKDMKMLCPACSLLARAKKQRPLEGESSG